MVGTGENPNTTRASISAASFKNNPVDKVCIAGLFKLPTNSSANENQVRTIRFIVYTQSDAFHFRIWDNSTLTYYQQLDIPFPTLDITL